jgi:hypothetical protein
MRVALQLAVRAGLGRGSWKALAAVLSHVTSYSRIEDDVTLRQLAPIADLSERELGRRLKELDAAGIITYTPGRGSRSRIPSRVGLPPGDIDRRDSAPPNPDVDRSNSAPLNQDIDRRGLDTLTGAFSEIDRRDSAPLPEKVPEETSEKKTAASAKQHSEPKARRVVAALRTEGFDERVIEATLDRLASNGGVRSPVGWARTVAPAIAAEIAEDDARRHRLEEEERRREEEDRGQPCPHDDFARRCSICLERSGLVGMFVVARDHRPQRLAESRANLEEFERAHPELGSYLEAESVSDEQPDDEQPDDAALDAAVAMVLDTFPSSEVVADPTVLKGLERRGLSS